MEFGAAAVFVKNFNDRQSSQRYSVDLDTVKCTSESLKYCIEVYVTVAISNVLEFHLQLQVMANGTVWKLKFSKKFILWSWLD